MSLDILKVKNGVLAGVVGTGAMTVVMMVKKAAGVLPALDPIHMTSTMVSDKLGIEPNVVIGWVMHWGIGSVLWGGIFALANNILPGKSQLQKGLVLGVIAWFVMMVGPMPASGAGLFGMQISVAAPVMTLFLHLVYGGVLGMAYLKLDSRK